MSRIVVIDAGLNLKGGHHPGHLRRVVQALDVAPEHIAILTNHDIDLTEIAGAPVLAMLPATGYEGFLRKPGDSDAAGQEQAAAQALALALLRADPMLARAERVLVLNVTPITLAAVLHWSWLRGRRFEVPLSLYMLTGAGLEAGPEGFTIRDAGRKALFETALRELPGRIARLRIHATSETRRAELEHLGARDVALYTLSMIEARPVSRSPSGGSGHILLYAGDAKVEKGIGDLPELIDRLQAVLPDQPLALHVNDAEAQFTPLLDQIRARLSPMVSLQTGFLEQEAYRELLANARLVILLHRAESYRDMESGLANECFAAAIPLLCRHGTLVAQEMARHDGAETFIFGDTAELAPRIVALLQPDTGADMNARFTRLAEAMSGALGHGPL